MSEVYGEKARSYASLGWVSGLLVAGFLLDLNLGGGIAHLPGWILAFVVVVGLNFLVLYAVRSEKSLTLTADELRVGDEAVPRADVVGFAASAEDAATLPVLGWPGGMPRGGKGVTVRLADGRDVIVPTRAPEQLRAALGLDPAALPARGQDVRAAAKSDLAALPEIADRADTLFRLADLELPDIPLSLDGLRAAPAVFVAGRPPVGFVQLEEVDGLAHVSEIAVVPKWMRQGIGSRLLERACEWARAKGYPAITLITYAEVAWNAPFYAARGFAESADVTPGLAALRTRERELGLDAVGRRVVMRRDLA